MLRTSTLLLAVTVSLAMGCGGGARLAVNNEQPYFLLTNLRPQGTTISSLNDWKGDTMLPVCTQVQVGSARGREIRFTANGQDFRYQIHRRSSLPLDAHFQRLFGTGCPNIQALTPVEQAGIQRGLPYGGMSKAAVIIAMGYPPDQEGVTLDQTPWTYRGAHGAITASFMADTLMSVEGRPDEPVLIAAAQGAPAVGPMVATTTDPANTNGGQTTSATSTEPMVVVTDANGYPTQVPESAVGKPCGVGQPNCHPGLICQSGTCQGAQP